MDGMDPAFLAMMFQAFDIATEEPPPKPKPKKKKPRSSLTPEEQRALEHCPLGGAFVTRAFDGLVGLRFEGRRVNGVKRGGPAAERGVRKGWRITRVLGKDTPNNTAGVKAALARARKTLDTSRTPKEMLTAGDIEVDTFMKLNKKREASFEIEFLIPNRVGTCNECGKELLGRWDDKDECFYCMPCMGFSEDGKEDIAGEKKKAATKDDLDSLLADLLGNADKVGADANDGIIVEDAGCAGVNGLYKKKDPESSTSMKFQGKQTLFEEYQAGRPWYQSSSYHSITFVGNRWIIQNQIGKSLYVCKSTQMTPPTYDGWMSLHGDPPAPTVMNQAG